MAATVVNAVTALNIGAGGTIVSAVTSDNTNGNQFTQGNDSMLRLVNTDASSHTVTFTYPLTVDGATVPSKVITLAASEVRYVACGLGPSDKYLYPGGVIFFQTNSNLVKFELVNF